MSIPIPIVSELNVEPGARIIQGLVATIVADIGALYKASEAVSVVPKISMYLTNLKYPGCARRYAVVIFSCINQLVLSYLKWAQMSLSTL